MRVMDKQHYKRFTFLCVAVLILFVPPNTLQQQCADVQEAERFDCLPEKASPDQNECNSRKCCWSPASDPNVPSCFYGRSYPSYTVHETATAKTATLKREGSSGFPGDVQQLTLDVENLNENILHVKIYDSNQKRYEPPVPKLEAIQPSSDGSKCRFSISTDASFKVTRQDTNEEIFNTDIGGFIFSDQFLQISTRLPSKYIYGIGEHNERLLLNTTRKTYTLFNRGELVPEDNPQFNLYGSHPFYLSIEKSGKTHGVFLLNSNAMDIVLHPTPALTYRAIGGILDFYFFMGPTPDDVISQYTTLIGKPFLPPYWSLGFHLSRYGYNSADKNREVWKRNVDAGIPFDTQWGDIDYMDQHKIFTYDPKNFKGLRKLVDDIHKAGMYWVPITDPGLSGSEEPGKYPPYDQAAEQDILIKDYKGAVLKAKVWQDVTVFVDFSNPKAQDYWKDQFQEFYNQLPFDGSWIDMNEPYSFANGSLEGCNKTNNLDNPPYVPGKEQLFSGTICPSSQQSISTHYNLHNLYSFMEGIATERAMREIRKKRPFVLTRSQFAGYGHYGAHWTGDIHSRWSFMKYSIPNILNFNMFGVPMVGGDICGFVGNTTEEMCTRWTQLGAFYTFSRNHNDIDTIEQDPVIFGKNMIERVTKVLKIRYSLLPYLYTLFFNSHMYGTPVLRPLFFDHLNDEATYSNDRQFLWGKALMILPVLEPNTTTVTAYFPKGIWYDFYTGSKIESTGKNVTLNAPIDTINLAVKAGRIIALQEPGRTTQESRKNPFQLIVALDRDGNADGELYWDDGDSLDTVKTETYNHITFSTERIIWGLQTELTTSPTQNKYKTSMKLSKIVVYGLKRAPESYVQVNNRVMNHKYDDRLKTLQIDKLNVSLLEENTFRW